MNQKKVNDFTATDWCDFKIKTQHLYRMKNYLDRVVYNFFNFMFDIGWEMKTEEEEINQKKIYNIILNERDKVRADIRVLHDLINTKFAEDGFGELIDKFLLSKSLHTNREYIKAISTELAFILRLKKNKVDLEIYFDENKEDKL